MNNSTTGTATTDDFTLFEYLFYESCGIIGTIFNATVLYIALRYINTEDKPRQIIVINMAMADLLMCIVYMLTRPYLKIFSVFLCKPYYVAIWTCQMSSCFNLVWLNLDKLIYIQFPLHYYQIVNRKKLLWLSAATWGCIIVFNVALVNFFTVNGSCLSVSFSSFLPIVHPIFYFVMIIISFSLSALIYCIAHNLAQMEERQRSKLFHRLFFLFSSTLWTFFTCLPYRGFYLIFLYCDQCATKALVFLTSMFFKMLIVGIVINPIITIWTQRIYRLRLIRLLGKLHNNSSTEVLMVSNRRSSERPLENQPLRCDV